MTAEKPGEDVVGVADASATLKDVWAIRPCDVYEDEYSDCKSIKARFQQYFVHGEKLDCSQWKRDFDNCVQYKKSNDLAAGQAVIDSETERRNKRMAAHYGNTTWHKRTSPPENWASPLPEFLAKRYENTFLELKQKEFEGLAPAEKETKSYCTIM